MIKKILIALQYWGGDKAQAMKLASYMADLEPVHSHLADLLLVNRFDCSPDPITINHIKRKFNTFVYKSPRRGIGWPHGCNSLFFGTMDWVQSMLAAKKVPDYKAVFLCEGDGAPLVSDWITRMSEAWDLANSISQVCVAGPMVPSSPYGMHEHINGNCLITGELKFLTWITRHVSDINPGVGWDYILAGEFRKRGWADIPGMRSLYRTLNFTEDEFLSMRASNWFYIHGDKSNSLIKHGRKFILGQ